MSREDFLMSECTSLDTEKTVLPCPDNSDPVNEIPPGPAECAPKPKQSKLEKTKNKNHYQSAKVIAAKERAHKMFKEISSSAETLKNTFN